MLGPMMQVARRGDGQSGLPAIPLGVHHHVKAVIGHSHTRVFTTARAFIWALAVAPVRKEHRSLLARKMETVGRRGIADARRTAADALGRIVLGAVEHYDFPFINGSSRIKRVTALPCRRVVVHRAEKANRSVGRDNGIRVLRTHEPRPCPGRGGFGRSGRCLFLCTAGRDEKTSGSEEQRLIKLFHRYKSVNGWLVFSGRRRNK